MIGGSADLAPSNKSNLTFQGAGDFLPGHYGGRNLHFGIREHAMAGIVNGMSLSGLRSYGATFFVFTDYMRAGMRLASIMHQPVTYILTHDSIGVGEDGPTHQPVEHLTACRAIPGLYVFRPGDANEVAECYRTAMKMTTHPSAFVLSRQNMATLDREKYAPANLSSKGGYILSDCDGTPDTILMGSGSELGLCVQAANALTADGMKVRVVSMPCLDLFADQSPEYQQEVLPNHVTNRVAVEAGLRMSWTAGWDSRVSSSACMATVPAGRTPKSTSTSTSQPKQSLRPPKRSPSTRSREFPLKTGPRLGCQQTARISQSLPGR